MVFAESRKWECLEKNHLNLHKLSKTSSPNLVEGELLLHQPIIVVPQVSRYQDFLEKYETKERRPG